MSRYHRPTMTPEQRTAFETKLKELQRELLSRGPAKIEPNRTSEAEMGDLEDEQPLNEMLQSVASGLNKNQEREAALIMVALRKLRDEPDEYGVCEDCGEDIPLPRLNAKPFAQFCVQCQARADGPKQGPTRKKLTDYR
jgi:DnaK suppressor protein